MPFQPTKAAPPPPDRNWLQRIMTKVFSPWFGRASELEGRDTTQSGKGRESPSTAEAEAIQLEYDRQSIVRDVRQLMDDDPRMSSTNQDIGRDVVGNGWRVQVRAADGAPGAMAERAQSVIDALWRDCDVNGILPGMASGLLEDGDLFISPILQGEGITRLQILPTLSIERIEDDRGLHPDVTAAFRQIDVHSRQEITTFPLWQVNHVRYDLRLNRGDKYGRSQYLQARLPGKYLGMTENDLVIRRKTRAPLRFHHEVGTAEQPSDWADVTKYKAENSLDKPQNQRVTTDFFSNGKVKINALDGDANLSEIEDVEHLQNVYMFRLGRPKGLTGFGEGINRDVLEEQLAEYHKYLRSLRNLLWNGDGGVYSGLKAICDFALSLAGINPAMVTYQPSWPVRLSAEEIKYIDVINELRLTGMISRRTALGLIGALLGIEDPDAEIEALLNEFISRSAADNAADRAFVSRTQNAKGVGAG